jgi:hypothetical protein
MDADPELDVTLSNGRRVMTFQITALDHDLGTWTVVDPPVPRRVVLGHAEALALRRQIDARIAARLAAGWVPVDTGPAGTPATALPADLALQVSSLLEALTRGREALRTADPTGQLWAACITFLQQAQRFGVAPPLTRRAKPRARDRSCWLSCSRRSRARTYGARHGSSDRPSRVVAAATAAVQRQDRSPSRGRASCTGRTASAGVSPAPVVRDARGP